MKIIKQTTARNVALLSCLSWAAVAAAANNQLENISINEAAAGKVEVLLNFSSPVAIPKGFVMENPPRIVFDFPGVEVAPTARHNNTKRGVLNAVQAAGSKGQTRLVFKLDALVDYTVESSGNDMVLLFSGGSAHKPAATERVSSAQTVAPASQLKADESYNWYHKPGTEPAVVHPQAVNPAAQTLSQMVPPVKLEELPPPPPKPAKASQPLVYRPIAPPAVVQPRVAPIPKPPIVSALSEAKSIYGLRSVDFRREPDGGGRVIITLPDGETKVTDDKAANTLNLILEDVDVPMNWQKRLDVVDFATPVSNIQISQRGMNGRVSIMASEDFTYRTERDKNVYTVYLDKIKAPKKEVLGEKKKKTFSGEKLSLNFQDIEVRAVLQLLADFTNKNIVVSDSVDGNITVRLKDVPWDQALDIVLESKNLGMRENGNVIWVAPNAELDAKDAQEIEIAKRKVELEPLVTEYIPVNFAKAADLSTLIKKKSVADEETSHSLLSARGSVSFDDRTNTLLIQDTATQVAEIRDLIKILDVPVQQVVIESRIVIANDSFGKQLGARFGVTPHWSNSGSNGIAGAGLGSGTDGYYNSLTSTSTGSTSQVKLPGLTDRLSVNLPTAGAAGKFGFSILTSDFLLDLELSALQAESKGEIIATPRVITSNQTKAVIEQGVEIPYQEASSAGNTSTSFKKAVLSLEVTPQITPDEHISMDLKVNQDTVGAVYNNVPSIDTREIQTKVLVENGQTVVLGGVHEENRIKSSTKVPVLGDLPMVGQVFRNTNRSDTKRELLIFVTPKIVDSKSK
ncbi:type IV pilus assembly protein PilQ [Thiothrix eikelboomii]|uniref:Type IV pilus assembly protein PilQ n=1 Tax=Thiothrix eikelboomii TaxID=92487 RepID=A0A1T4XX91_9GAMM|nr:type IV pilus secretin PilQ [Thiothrix eikelboomii]SKA93818.1 type IV pilus assembly protein PilQ [Thiothrix eikelboomii]